AGIPILVADVDQDGDADLIWGRGHNVGVYWLEQIGGESARSWQSHAIDTSWSCAHSLTLADVDGDGRDDLVTGKRYLGHDGRDPGENDPLAIYWYRFQLSTHTWRRHLISDGGRIGMDLDPKCVDIDGDGDIDVIAPARCGLSLLENLGDQAAAEPTPSTPHVDIDHTDPSFYVQDARRRVIETPLDWGVRRQDLLVGMQRAMGELPGCERRVPLDVHVESTERTDKYRRIKLTYRSSPETRVPAFLLVPLELTGPAPAMLCLHPTHALGKGQVCGLGGNPTRFYAHELAQRGYVCLAPDYPTFGDYAVDFASPDNPYASGSMRAIWDNLRAVDLLETLPEVDPDRIGCIGHSLGGHNALFTAAFDRRLRVIATSCGFTAFGDYYEGDLRGWTSDRYMPRIRDDFGNDPQRMPFDFPEILASMAPRPVFINAPVRDHNFSVQGVRSSVGAARKIFEIHDAAQNLHVLHPEVAHDFPDDVRKACYEWLDQHLAR
ncbi:MAG: alpha/beta fold hydrolase, partial [Planctomycetales bacterium]|nr:alpha/beta fold hydrolase [Planctomycetales bacterium]